MGYYIGVEIGGTKQQIVLGNEKCELIIKIIERIELLNGASDILCWLNSELENLIAAGEYSGKIKGIGVGFGGPVDDKTGKTLFSVHVKGWEDFQLKKWIEERTGISAFIGNDTAIGGMGEYYYGAGQGVNKLFYTNMGTGVGGCAYINGQPHYDNGIGVVFIGFMPIPDWTCSEAGRFCIVEKICSGPSITKRLRTLGYVEKKSQMYESSNDSNFSCEKLGEFCKKGDVFAVEEVRRIGNSFGLALTNLLSVFPAEKIVIGGGVANIGSVLFDAIRKSVHETVFEQLKGKYEIVPSQLMDDAVPKGALKLAVLKCEPSSTIL